LACLAALLGRSQRRPATAHDQPRAAGAATRPRMALAGLAVLVATLALAVTITATGAHVDEWLAELLLPTLGGAILFAIGMAPASPTPPRSADARRVRARLAAAAAATTAVTLGALYVVLAA